MERIGNFSFLKWGVFVLDLALHLHKWLCMAGHGGIHAIKIPENSSHRKIVLSM